MNSIDDTIADLEKAIKQLDELRARYAAGVQALRGTPVKTPVTPPAQSRHEEASETPPEPVPGASNRAALLDGMIGLMAVRFTTSALKTALITKYPGLDFKGSYVPTRLSSHASKGKLAQVGTDPKSGASLWEKKSPI